MHPPVKEWVALHAPETSRHCVDVGGRDINGANVVQADKVTVVDLHPGPNVDVVGDFTAWTPEEPVDLVVCTEVLEHSETWRDIVSHAYDILEPNGVLIVTCATGNRAPHSALDEAPIRDDEFYRNVSALELDEALTRFSDVVLDVQGDDLRAKAVK